MGKGWSDGDELSIAEQRVRENLVVIEDAQDVDVGLSVEIIDDRSSRIQIQVTANLHGLPFQDSHETLLQTCLLYTSPSPRDTILSRMPSSA